MKVKNEKEFREKIRQQLEQEHAQSRKKKPESDESESDFNSPKSPLNESVLWEEIIKRQIEEEVYGAHEEFYRCINHLGERKWLTPLELADTYEFYIDEEKFLHRLFTRLFKKGKIPKNISDELKEKIQRYKAELELDARERIDKFHRNIEEKKKDLTGNISELEKKIMQEETDRFYSKLPGYRKYSNHLGETKWMTEEEAAEQDEFMELVPTFKERLMKQAIITVSVLAVLSAVWFLFFSKPEHGKGYLLVKTNTGTAELYINRQQAVSFHPNKPFQLPSGKYTISLVNSNYDITPAMEMVTLTAGDTVTVSFNLTRKVIENSGVLRVKLNTENANIFIDDEFQGKISRSSQFILSPGQHTIAIEKDKFAATPTDRIVSVSPGDTIDISFSLSAEEKSKTTKKKTLYYGIVEVNTNINGAAIYLDGKKTNYKTDYVFQRLSPGQHSIRVEKEGYKVYPEEKLFKIDKKNRNLQITFTLTSLFRMIRINTTPVKADIYVDGKKVGRGLARVSLPLGKHTLTFGEVKYYKKQKPREIVISDNGETEFNITYSRNFFIQFSPQKVLPDAASGSINTGYLNELGKFVRSKSPGPDIISVNNGNSKAWRLGYAYQYRNPPGSDAIELGFNIPENINLSSPVRLLLYIYDSEENYPLAVRGTPNYTIMINNQLYKKDIIARNKKSELGESKYEEYIINHMLRRGFNKIRISTNDNTSAFVTLWKAIIK